ncbi:ankyrin repeat domain-containing protein [Paracoccus saliphilus]|uniref:Ankyrin repeat domain-containing protein n=1 Tax=Paracoccus saliphilus TaxID=405559 RepID=A0AA46A770_9RHOB|nr:ankyrin repeat domain-containing protein [Paracoccus saliphilus]SIT09041.1 hypothetical protein SAMN05421772_11725 [Paracoccus saliphilus]
MRHETAIRAGDRATVTGILREGTDPNHSGPEGLSPLMVAAGLGQLNMVKILLTAGANGLAIEPHRTPRHFTRLPCRAMTPLHDAV